MHKMAEKIEGIMDYYQSPIPVVKRMDMRKKGWFCIYCRQFSKQAELKEGSMWVNGQMPGVRWLVKSHYDGCRGWD